MNKIAKIIQFVGMAITGVGLFYGILQNDMRQEFTYLGLGIVVFLIGYVLERR